MANWGDKDVFYTSNTYAYDGIDDEVLFLMIIRFFHEQREIDWVPDAIHNGATDYSEWENPYGDRCMVRADEYGGPESDLNGITVAFIGDTMKNLAARFIARFNEP